MSQDFDRLELKRFLANRVMLLGSYSNNHLAISQEIGVVSEERKFEPAVYSETGGGYNSTLSFTPGSNLQLGRLQVEGEVTALKKTPHSAINIGYHLNRQNDHGDTITLNAYQGYGSKKVLPLE